MHHKCFFLLMEYGLSTHYVLGTVQDTWMRKSQAYRSGAYILVGSLRPVPKEQHRNAKERRAVGFLNGVGHQRNSRERTRRYFGA